MFDKIAIIGFGLIGSSLARVIKQKSLADIIACADSSPEVCQTAFQLGLADAATTSIEDAVKGADLVIVATPVGAYREVATKMASVLKIGAIVIDVGSVKQQAIDDIAKHIPKDVFFVPCHPIAGLETSGPEAGIADLFQNRWCILTPVEGTNKGAVKLVRDFWESCGSNIEIMEAKHHDLVLGITSHLPHLIAYSIVDTAATLENDTKAEVIKYSAGGFRDFTRIATSDPVMWRDIFLNNKEAVLEILQRFNKDLTTLEKAIRNGNGNVLEDVFTRTRAIRKDVLEANK